MNNQRTGRARPPTILPPEMRGVMFITGYRGIGKSYLTAQADLPQNIAFFDFEQKGEGIDADIHFGAYHAVTVEAKDGGGIVLYEYAMKLFNALPEQRFTVLAMDNVSPLEMSFGAEAVRNRINYARQYGFQPKKIQNNSFGQKSGVVNCMISDLCTLLFSKGIKLVIATSHVKPQWAPGGFPIPGKYRYKGADRWQELSILTLILGRGDNPPIPSAIIQKEQLGRLSINRDPSPEELAAMQKGETGHTVIRRLPERLPEATFQRIRWYLSNPADFGNLAEDEQTKAEEASAFEEKLSLEQLGYVTAAMRMKAEEERSQRADGPRASGALFMLPERKQAPPTSPVVDEIVQEIKKLRPLDDAAIKAKLRGTHKLPDVIRALALVKE